jgi:hypothetical protein
MPWSDVDPRWAEARILAHTERRSALGLAPPAYALPEALHTVWDRDTLAPPPALTVPIEHPGDPQPIRIGPSTHPTRWAARFRDGLPPPPPLPLPIRDEDVLQVADALGIDRADPALLTRLHQAVDRGMIPPLEEAARALRQTKTHQKLLRAQSLVPQDLLDGKHRPPSPPPIPTPSPPPPSALRPSPPPPPMMPDLIFAPAVQPLPSTPAIPAIPIGGPMSPAPAQQSAYPPGPLSKSQRRRLRRRRSQPDQEQPPAHTPPAQQQAIQPVLSNGHVPGPPVQNPGRAVSYACEARLKLILPDTVTPSAPPFELELVCPLRPWPHPNQPHVVELPAYVAPDVASAFICWYDQPQVRA